MKKVFFLLLALVLVCSLAVPAQAATVTIDGKDNIKFRPGSTYHATDLFDEQFKNVMPGDTVYTDIVIHAGFANFSEDSVKVWMRAIPHNADGNSPVTGVDFVSMQDFLHQLELKVYNLSKNGELIFKGKADELDDLRNNVLLGSFRKSSKIVLRVELVVPIELDNKYANRVGELDWLFTVEAWDDPSVDNPKTGDYIMLAAGVMLFSAAAIIILLFWKRRKREE